MAKRVSACVLDWSGTLCDKYVIAPAIVFKKVFENNKINVTMKQARKPMGSRKDLHIKEMLMNDSDIFQQWMKIHDTPSQDDIMKMYNEFVPLQLNCLRQYGTLLPGVVETLGELQRDGIKMGCSTGFSRDMVEILDEEARNQGLYLDSVVAGDDVKNGSRPSPHMLYKNMDNMNIDSIETVVKIDDTTGGILEGLNAGCWTVGVSRYGNYMDIDDEHHELSLSETEIKKRNLISAEILKQSGAHYVIDSVADLPKVIESINHHLAHEACPSSLHR